MSQRGRSVKLLFFDAARAARKEEGRHFSPRKNVNIFEAYRTGPGAQPNEKDKMKTRKQLFNARADALRKPRRAYDNYVMLRYAARSDRATVQEVAHALAVSDRENAKLIAIEHEYGVRGGYWR